MIITINLSNLEYQDAGVSSTGKAQAEFLDDNGDTIIFEAEYGNGSEIYKAIWAIEELVKGRIL